MKYILSALIAALIMTVSSCGQEEIGLLSDHTGTTVDETTAGVTTVTETQGSSDIHENIAEPTADADEIISAYDSMALTFEPSGLPDEVFDESDVDTTYHVYGNNSLYTIMDFEANLLGRRAEIKTVEFKRKSTDRVCTYSTCADTETGEIFCQGFNILFSDVDSDDRLEILKDGQLTVERDGEYLTADLNASFENYVSSKYPQNPDHDTRVSMIRNTDV